MRPTPEAAFLKKATGWSIVLSVLMIVAGIIAIAAPAHAGLAVTIVVGWLLIFSGVMHLVFAWRKSVGNLLWESLIGVLYIFTGGYLLMRPVVGLASLTIMLAIYLLFEAVLEFAQFFRLRGQRGSGWLLFHGVITLLLAIIIWRHWPSSKLWVVGTLVGVSMLFNGISRFMLSLGARRALA